MIALETNLIIRDAIKDEPDRASAAFLGVGGAEPRRTFNGHHPGNATTSSIRCLIKAPDGVFRPPASPPAPSDGLIMTAGLKFRSLFFNITPWR